MVKMKTSFSKNFVILFSLILSSCLAQSESQTKIRIVNLQGKSRPIQTKIPELNSIALLEQGKTSNDQHLSSNNVVLLDLDPKTKASNSRNIAPVTPNMVQETLQTPQEPKDKKLINTLAANENQEVEYDLAVAKKTPIKSAKKLTNPKKAVKKARKKDVTSYKQKKGLFVQVGSFSKVHNAKRSLAMMKKFHSGRIEKTGKKKTYYRVLLGPFSTNVAANKVIKKITNSGHEAILMRNR